MPQLESVALPPRLPLVVSIKNRAKSLAGDSRLVNCFIETDEAGELWIRKRPGIEEATTGPAGLGLGAFNWRGDIYTIFANVIYKNGVALPGVINSAGGSYRFSSILGATPKMVFGNGAKTYATDGTTVSAALDTIDPDFPAVTVKGVVYLNGATYVMTPDGRIFGSVINSVDQPGDWSALNFISAQIEPDEGVALAKQLVYVIAFGQWSTEVFFDAGNPTGSPLGNVQGSKLSYGCATAESLQEIDDRLFWISSTKSAAVQISMMDQLNHQVISDEFVDRIVQSSTLASVTSQQLKIDGHSFYILTLRDINTTLVYDIAESQWHVWTDANSDYFPMSAYTYNGTTKQHIFQHESNGSTYYVSSSLFNDDGLPIVLDIYTPSFDGNTRRRKHLKIMTFIGDIEAGSTLYVRNSDDDLKHWENFRKVDLGQRLPMLTNCGTFQRRAYHFRHKDDTAFRIQAVEIQYDLGTL